MPSDIHHGIDVEDLTDDERKTLLVRLRGVIDMQEAVLRSLDGMMGRVGFPTEGGPHGDDFGSDGQEA